MQKKIHRLWRRDCESNLKKIEDEVEIFLAEVDQQVRFWTEWRP